MKRKGYFFIVDYEARFKTKVCLKYIYKHRLSLMKGGISICITKK